MFIRKKTQKNPNNGRIYTCFQLVESFQTEQGPRSRVLLYIGDLEIDKAEMKLLSGLVDRKIKGRPIMLKFSDKLELIADDIISRYYQKSVDESDDQQATLNKVEYTSVDLQSLEQSHYRSVGAETIGIHYWKALDLEGILQDCGLTIKERDLAQAVVLGRLISPGSELRTYRWLHQQTSLPEFLRTGLADLSKDAIYSTGDLLLSHKPTIESRLRANLKSLYPTVDRVYLYDLTNTYFEGNKLNSVLCQRGKSKERRDDCPLVTLALVVDQDGFPVYSRIYRGNQSEPGTLKDILREVYTNGEDAIERLLQPSIVMDRGIATKENIAYLKANGYSYFVVERANAVKAYRDEFSQDNAFEEYETSGKERIWLRKLTEADTVRVLVRSEGRENKEQAIINKIESRFLEDAGRLLKSNQKGTLVQTDKINIRIGRLNERYSSIFRKYSFILIPAADHPHQTEKIILEKSGQEVLKDSYAGCYVIETDKQDLSAKEIWDFYTKLTEVEASFRSMKSELGTRPVFHQKDSRIEAHLFISVLAYSLLRSITYKLNQAGCHISWSEVREVLKTHMRATTILNSEDGYIYHVRVTGRPENTAKKIYNLLNIKIHSKRVINKFRL